jgi:hypothetical protein
MEEIIFAHFIISTIQIHHYDFFCTKVASRSIFKVP